MNKITSENFDKSISKIKCDLLLHYQFFGLIVAKLNIKLVEDNIDDAIAYTNGKSICFIKKVLDEYELNIENIKFIICHEILHLLLDHLLRREDRNPIVWNYATDYLVNYMLKYNKNSNTSKIEPIGEMPDCCLYDEQYNDQWWNAERIYKDLMEKGGSKDGKLKIVNLSAEDGRKLKSDLHTSQSGKGEISKEEAAYFASEICSNLDKGCGKSDIPEGISRLLNSLSNINYNWKSILYRYVKRIMTQSNSTWKRPSRKSVAVKTYLPRTNKAEYFKFTIAVDTSGSMDKSDIDDVLSNILSICRQLDRFTLNIFTFSGTCHKDTLQTFTEKDIFNKINNFQMKSNWSTDIKSAFEFINENESLKDSDLFIVMTDGYDYSLSDLQYNKPLIWCICNNPQFKNPEGCSKSRIISMPRGKNYDI